NVIIIGSGPAGYTAAIYAARGDLKPLVFEGSVTAGGALMNTTDVENFPGFPDGILGPDLMDNLRKQADRFGAEFITDDVTEVDLLADPKVVKSGDDTYLTRAVIIATGSGYRELGLPDEKRLSGRGVSWCATCDGFFFREQDVAVVGGGDTAMEEAIFLTKFARSVTVIHRRDTLRASKIMQERAFANEKIKFLWDSEVTGISGEDRVTGLTVRNNKTGETSTLEVTGLFVAIGHDPRSELFAGQLETDSDGYLIVDAPTTKTKVPGVFACGEVVDHTYGQAATAAGTGAAAAIDAERWLQAQDAGDDGARSGPAPAPHPPDVPPVAGRRPVRAVKARDRVRRRDTTARRAWTLAPREREGEHMKAVTDADFESEVLKNDKPVLVDFWAEWCGPCRMVAPILEESSKEHGDKIDIVKLNIDENPKVPQQYGIMQIPTMNVYKD